MKNTLLALLSIVSIAAQATSPVRPALDKNFEVSCTFQIAVLSQLLNPNRGNGIEVYNGSIEFKLQDAYDSEGLAKRIKWTEWDSYTQSSFPIELSQVKGRPEVTEIEFYPHGARNSNGKLASYSIALAMDYNAEDNSSKIGLKAQGNASMEDGGRLDTEAETSHSLGNKKTTYSTHMSCTAKN